MRRKPEEEFAVPPPRKRQKPNPPEEQPELDPEMSRVIESESEFTAQYLYRMHDELDAAVQSNADLRMKYQS
jgi:hypothetical protein